MLDYEELRIGGYIFEGKLNRRFKPSAGKKTVSRPLPAVARDDTDIVLRSANRGASVCSSSDSGDNAVPRGQMSQDDIGLAFRRNIELAARDTPSSKRGDLSPSLTSEARRPPPTERTPTFSPKSPADKKSPLKALSPHIRALSRDDFFPFEHKKMERKRSRSVTDVKDLYQDASDEFPSEIVTATGKVIPVLPLHLQRTGPKLYPSRYDSHWDDIDYSEDMNVIAESKSRSSAQSRKRGASGENITSPPPKVPSTGLRFTLT